MKKFVIFLLFTVIIGNALHAQPFLMTYNYQPKPTRPVDFECITSTTDQMGNFYIGGHVGDSIAIFKMNNLGSLLSTYVIKNTGTGSQLDGIIIDNSGNIVVIGNYETSSTGQGFVFKFVPPSSVAWFSVTNLSDLIVLQDIVLIPNSSNYRVSGSNGLSTFNHAVILDVNGSTGSITPLFKNYYVTGTEDAAALQIANNQVYVTGRYAVGGASSTFRVSLSRFDLSANHLGSKYYQVNQNVNARLYSTDMVMSTHDGVICGWGDDNGQNVFENLTLTKVKSTNGNLIWSNKYDNLSASFDGTFNEIRYDNGVKNYVVMGYTYTTSLDEAFLVYLDLNGHVKWSNKYPFYRHPTIFGENHQFVFAVKSGFIYAVGQKLNSSGILAGALLKVSTTNGTLTDINGGSCSDTLSFAVTPYTFSSATTPIALTPTFTSTLLTVSRAAVKMTTAQICGGACSITGTIDVSSPNICFYDSATLFATGSGGVAPYHYQWSPAATVTCPTCSVTVAHPTTTTTYSCLITDANGCTVTKTITVTVDSTCCPCAIPTGEHYFCNCGCGGGFYWNVDSCALSYDIFYTDLTTSTSFTVTGITGTNYNPPLTNGHQISWQVRAECNHNQVSNYSTPQTITACTGQSCCKLGAPNADNSSGSLEIYPNPAASQFTLSLKLDNGINTVAKIEILNTLGQTVYSQESTVVNGSLKNEISLDHALAEGVYMIKVNIEAGNLTSN